jgi:hypothetical protein
MPRVISFVRRHVAHSQAQFDSRMITDYAVASIVLGTRPTSAGCGPNSCSNCGGCDWQASARRYGAAANSSPKTLRHWVMLSSLSSTSYAARILWA